MRSVAALTLCSVLPLLVAACSSKQSAPAPQVATPAADGSHGDAVPAAVSGTRLRATYITSAEGARQFTGWFDTERKEACQFQVAEDQKLRCLPTAGLAIFTGVYSDAKCTVQLASTDPTRTCEVGTTVSQDTYGNDQCGQRPKRQILALAKFEGPVYRPGASGCTATPRTAGAVYFAMGASIPAASFVEGTETLEPGAELVAKHIVASDGAREHRGWKLKGLYEDCAFEVMGDGETRCLPNGAPGQELFSDSSCGLVAGAAVINDYGGNGGPCSVPTPSVWLRRNEAKGACEPVSAIFSVGYTVTSGKLYQKNTYDDRCQERDSNYSSYGRVVHLGDDLTPTLPRTARISASGGRLVAALVATPGSRQLVPGWHDTVLRADCVFSIAADGKTRCLPVGARAAILYKDTACKGTERVAALESPACTADTTAFALEPSAAGTCPSTTRVYSLGAVQDLTVASTPTITGQCARLAGPKNVFNVTEMAPTEFVEGVATTE